MSRYSVLPVLSGIAHSRHSLHGENCIWVEKNCYIDLWIELLHALKLEPRAILSFVFTMDFEGDQWTFFKPPLSNLRRLYGIDVQELTIWRPLIKHAAEHLAAGKLLSVEADAFWLPDTVGTDYRNSHSKTTIVMNELNLETRQLGYFHNAGYYSLDGEDFAQLFDVAPKLPLYAEMIRVDRVIRHHDSELRLLSLALFVEHLAWRPSHNPIKRYQTRFQADILELQDKDLAYYHLYAFAGIRQLGAGFELAADYMRWAFGERAECSAAAFELIAQHSKTLILKAARAVNSTRALNTSQLFEEMIEAWERGMSGALDLSTSS
jgi:hypothetical protein